MPQHIALPDIIHEGETPADRFITRWTSASGGAERANYALFLSELCDLIAVPRPRPAGHEMHLNDYVFERGVKRRESEGLNSTLRIDLYKKGCFILEAKQSRLPGNDKALTGQNLAVQHSLPGMAPPVLGRRTIARGWDAMMVNARKQAEDYVFRLEAEQPVPVFTIVCDVGHCLELYADFTGTGRAYTQYPDRQTFRVFMEDLRNPAIRQRLATVWTDPASLNPTREKARVTRSIAERLAAITKALEQQQSKSSVSR